MNPNLIVGCGRLNLKNTLLQAQSTLRLDRRNKVVNGINIPNRIERTPTEILAALSATVKTESIPPYRFPDAIPLIAPHQRKLLALSTESGRTSARWIVRENPSLFEHRVAEPYIDAYAPPKKYTEKSVVSEETLLSTINNIEVEESMKLYDILTSKGIDVQQSTKQQLLELVCFYNSSNKPDELLLEKNYFLSGETVLLNTWKDDFPLKLLSEMEHTTNARSALILGKNKYNDAEGARQLFLDGQEKGMKFPVEVFNAVLRRSHTASSSNDATAENVLRILRTMEREGVKPNVYTLNAVLACIADSRKWFQSRAFALKVFNEFTSIGIKPSLASYYYLIKVFFDRTKVNTIFEDILDSMKGVCFDLQHEDDTKFFVRAMEISALNFNDVSLCKKVDNILNTGNNIRFLHGAVDEHTYYQRFLQVSFRNDFEFGYKRYRELAPYVAYVDVPVLTALLDGVEANEKYEYLERIWKDIRSSSYYNYIGILTKLVINLRASLSKIPEDVILTVTTEVWNNTKDTTIPGKMDDEFISNFLYIFSVLKDLKMACEVFDSVTVDEKIRNVIFTRESIELFINLCISGKRVEAGLRGLEYAAYIKCFGLYEVNRRSTSQLPADRF
ncbi:UNVERIFIED_CONTAM: hypothetical protein PYX00_007730 [Menopon gallinae]|uniref:Small ribosomal subunit protein mS39 n=1 Tax=Menopon gallinae TaxID=328185 RepID=A0AAW2HJZ0_9NEOP